MEKKITLNELRNIVKQLVKENQSGYQPKIEEDLLYTVTIINKYPDDPALNRLPKYKVVNTSGEKILDYVESMLDRNKHLTKIIKRDLNNEKDGHIFNIILRDNKVHNEDVITFEINKFK